MKLTSSDFEDGEQMPEKVGYMEKNVNPELDISEVPENTESLALIMDDPDAMEPAGKIWVHWVVYNINPLTTDIGEDESPGTEGITDFRKTGYNGPNPPDQEHMYVFKVYALDTELDLKEGASKEEVEEAIESHVIEEAKLKGSYPSE